MRLPCEIVIIDILPVIRKELAVQLFRTHRLSKMDIAKMFGVSGTAISQYIHGMRGDDSMIRDNLRYPDLVREIHISAATVAAKENSVAEELCRLCDFAKQMNLAEHVYQKRTGVAPDIVCAECPRRNMC